LQAGVVVGYRGGMDNTPLPRSVLSRLADRLVERGKLTRDEIDWFIREAFEADAAERQAEMRAVMKHGVL
jgi:polyhydroxyalkanoate synthesis regulator phasin